MSQRRRIAFLLTAVIVIGGFSAFGAAAETLPIVQSVEDYEWRSCDYPEPTSGCDDRGGSERWQGRFDLEELPTDFIFSFVMKAGDLSSVIVSAWGSYQASPYGEEVDISDQIEIGVKKTYTAVFEDFVWDQGDDDVHFRIGTNPVDWWYDIYGSDSDEHAVDIWRSGGADTLTTPVIADLAYSIDTGIAASIEFLFPEDEGHADKDFSTFQVEYTSVATSTDAIFIQWGTTTSTPSDFAMIDSIVGGTETPTIRSVYNNGNPTAGETYYARSRLGKYTCTGPILDQECIFSDEEASSEWISFIADESDYFGEGYFPPPTSTTTAIVLTCDPESGFFAQSFCKLYIFLFSPSEDVMSDWATLGDRIKTKPPVGYAYAVHASYNDIASSSAAFTLAEIEGVSSDIFDPLKTGLAWILWFGFGVFLIKRFAKLEL